MRMVWALVMAAMMLCGVGQFAPAHASPGGSLAMAGPCDYPFIGHQFYGGGVFYWYCDGPPEVNCTRWHAEGKGFNAGGPTGSGDYGFSFAGFGINIAGGVLGGGDGWQGYLYPDNTAGPIPNPPGAWKEHLTPRCPKEHNHPPPPPPVAPADGPQTPVDVNPTPPNDESTKPEGQ